ncbi:MAG: acyl-ACP--UDP-N-acetylglucosamine O-acyltransferase [Shimia sp.]
MPIHPSAIVEEGAEVDPSATVGPFCIVGAKVRIGPRVLLKSHVVVQGDTEIGAETIVFPFTVLGEIPQDLKFKGEATRLRIGARNRIREHVTMNTGTEGGGGETRVGDDGLFMAGCHIAHDAQVGDKVIVVNSAAIAGHCVLEDEVIVGGLSGVHQWVRVGRGAIIGALSMVTADVVPHALVHGPRAVLEGLNLVGLKRRGVPRADIQALRAAFQTLAQGEGAFVDRAKRLEGDDSDSPHVADMIRFILGDSDRRFLTPK